jgi:NAD(P)-dependent dehydrogenase (short-subunit alcohol dehydrogenase family)
MDKFNLKERVAIITGCAGLLGRQHAFAIAEKKGIVVAIDVNIERLRDLKNDFNKKNFEISIFKSDITNEISVNKIKNKIKKKYGRIDILINNAQSDYVPIKKFKVLENSVENYSLIKWEKEINVGLKGAFICSKIFGKEMAVKKSGVIINVASDLSVIAPDQRLYDHMNAKKPVTYSVIKHGLIGLTKYLASYWSDRNIRVNAISPGGIYNNQNKVFVKKIKKLIPLNRMAYVEEYKGAIQFLCSDASSYMTGHNLVIDGGRTII